MMSSKIEDRLILVLTENGEPYGHWQYLEQQTKISAQRWRGVIARRQRPTTDMIEVIAKTHPEYAFWIITGITDAANGHIAPQNAMTFPEFGTKNDVTESRHYFEHCIKLNEYLFQEADVNIEDDAKRLDAISMSEFAGFWQTKEIADYAYKIANTEEYRELSLLAKEREERRALDQEQFFTSKPRTKDQSQTSEETGRSSTIFFNDARTLHQDNHNLFWLPIEASNPLPKFALSVLNVPPSKLSDDQLRQISDMSHQTVASYLEYHGLDKRCVFPHKDGFTIGDVELSKEEIKALYTLIFSERKNIT